MKRPRRIFLIISILFSFSFYAFILGESGLIVRNRLRSDLKEMDRRIVEMEMENEMLNERYILLHEKKDENRTEAQSMEDVRAVILKFDDPEHTKPASEEMSNNGGFLFSGRMTLTQARILFIGLMAIITAGGALLIRPVRPVGERAPISPSSPANARL